MMHHNAVPSCVETPGGKDLLLCLMPSSAQVPCMRQYLYMDKAWGTWAPLNRASPSHYGLQETTFHVCADLYSRCLSLQILERLPDLGPFLPPIEAFPIATSSHSLQSFFESQVTQDIT